MEREVKADVFMEIFVVVVVPIQFVEFRFIFIDFVVSNLFQEFR